MADKKIFEKEPHSMQPSEVKRLYGWVKFFLLAAIASGLMTIVHGLHARFDPQYLIRPGRVTHVHIGGRDFAVPDEYIRGPRPSETNQKDLYIWLTLPDYKPYMGEYEERKNPEPIGYRLITVLIDDTAFATDLKFRYDVSRNGIESSYKPKDVRSVYGLNRSLIYYSNARSPEPFIWSDLYYQFSSKRVISRFIDCSPDKPPPEGSSCSHFFQDGRLIYQMSYSKNKLNQWKIIEDRIHNLVDSFSCAPDSKSLSSMKTGTELCPS